MHHCQLDIYVCIRIRKSIFDPERPGEIEEGLENRAGSKARDNGDNGEDDEGISNASRLDSIGWFTCGRLPHAGTGFHACFHGLRCKEYCELAGYAGVRCTPLMETNI